MTKKCYNVSGQQPGQVAFSVNQCWASIRVETRAPGPNGGTLYYITQATEGGPEIVSGDCEIALFTEVGCESCPGCCVIEKYDCINGSCTLSTVFNTPGVFDSLAKCVSGCATNSECDGECASLAQLAALNSAADIVGSKFCK